jgi:hypothetical protein
VQLPPANQPPVQNPEVVEIEEKGYYQRLCDFLSAIVMALFRVFCCLCIRICRKSESPTEPNAVEAPSRVNGPGNENPLVDEEDELPPANDVRAAQNPLPDQEDVDEEDEVQANPVTQKEAVIEKILAAWYEPSVQRKEEMRQHLKMQDLTFVQELEKNPRFTETLGKIAHSL